MSVWIEEADLIDIEDIENIPFRSTRRIDDFLAGNKYRIIMSTKGYGKTFLLKLKKRQLQRAGIQCIPDNVLLDKPSGEPIFSRDMVSYYDESFDNWKNLWSNAIALAFAKNRYSGINLELRDTDLRQLLDSPMCHSVCDFFSRLVVLGRDQTFRVNAELSPQVGSILNQIRTPLATFIDNVDEIFTKHLQKGNVSSSSRTGELGRNIWYYSQMGLIKAIFEVNRINHHIKIFASIRKEAFLRFASSSDQEMIQQYNSIAFDIRYSDVDLEHIFKENIQNESKQNLTDPNAKDLLSAFFGEKNLSFEHVHTGDVEKIFKYIFRHTLQRPRDFMTIGRGISDLDNPGERTEVHIKRSVNDSSTLIARQYIGEFQPHVTGLDLERFWGILPCNVLSKNQVHDICTQYNHQDSCRGRNCRKCNKVHVMCTLYRVGLIGYIIIDPIDNKSKQKFLKPGDQVFNNDSHLPESSHYLIHPSLDFIVRESNSGYKFSDSNIVGDARAWKTPDESIESIGVIDNVGVLKGDVSQYSKIIADQKACRAFARSFEKVVNFVAKDVLYSKVDGGDSVTIIHSNMDTLMSIARQLFDAVNRIDGRPVLRLVADYGEIEYEFKDEGGINVLNPITVRRAARIEPFSKPGVILITDSARNKLKSENSIFTGVKVNPNDYQKVPFVDGKANVKKPDSIEEDILVELYELIHVHATLTDEPIPINVKRTQTADAKRRAGIKLKIINLKSSGLSNQKIADKLNSERVPTFSGRGLWSASRIGDVAREP